MNKHTPGPWNNYQGDDIYCVYDAGGKKICSIEPVDIVGWNAVHREEADANEALIAAAPGLLAELEETHAALCFTPDYIGTERHKRNSAAIAKARGEA